MIEMKLTDEMQEYIAAYHCFSAAEGMMGQYRKNKTPYKHIDPRLHDVVVAVVVLRNGESFVGHTVCRKGVDHSFQTASAKAKAKAFRKVKEHFSKQRQGSLI